MRSRSNRLAVLLLAIIMTAAMTVVTLGVTMTRQDRARREDQESKRRETLLGTTIQTLSGALEAAVQEDAAIRLRLFPDGMVTESRRHVPWLPAVSGLRPADDPSLQKLDRQEFSGDPASVLSSYKAYATSPTLTVRAGALQRVGRVLWRQQRWDEAIAAYSDLALIDGVSINGTPASLVARRAECAVLEEAGRREALAEAARRLRNDLVAGHWRLDRVSWQVANKDITRWTGEPLPVSELDGLFAAAAETVWAEWQRGDGLGQPGARSRTKIVEGVTLTVLERRDDGVTTVAVLAPPAIQKWLQKLKLNRPVVLVSDDGTVIAGDRASAGPAPMLRQSTPAELPWTVLVDADDDADGEMEFVRGTALMWFGLALVVGVLVGGSYLLWHLMQREIAVARIQTEFVARVSHEFRTPLASLRHVTELLDENDELPPVERRAFYKNLARNTERLSRLVESLLDFARMESGRKPYDLRRVDLRTVAEQAVAEFTSELKARGYTLHLELPDAPMMVNADSESLSHALWNLLDNAMKYSPQSRDIAVFLHPHAHGVALAVKDHGLGIPRQERTEIFRRFMRGAKARELGIKGTGLGLAMVSHIVEAHNGQIELESQEGTGSTFRMVLPGATPWHAS